MRVFLDLHNCCGTNKNTTDKLQSTFFKHILIHVSVLIALFLAIGVNNVRATNYGNFFPLSDTIPDTLQTIVQKADSLLHDSAAIARANSLINDSILTDSNLSAIDSIADSLQTKQPPRMESTFNSKVDYDSDDSLMLDNRNNKAYMWGNAWVRYEGIEIKADYLEIDFEKNEVFAKGLPDSNGVIKNTPIYKEDGQEYEALEMLYNFHSKKGIITKATTQESSGYIHGDRIKMASENVFYIRDGRYTTCNLDHPHYYVKAHKLKIINNDKVVTGPAYLAVEDVPTFLAVPFGFFPNQDERTSGVLVPTFGSTEALGFSIVDGGYYFAISDKMDLKLQADFYTNGSWGARATTRYNQRYKRHGSFSLKYNNRKDGYKDTPSYQRTSTFFVNWTHRQDSKAKPNSDFSATLNLGSSNYYQNDFNTDGNNYLRNEFSSNITYSQRFGNSPFTLKLNAGHNQNNVDSTFYVKIPELTLTMARIFPFKRKVKIGRDKWYEKIGMTYTGNFKNELKTTVEDLGSTDNLKKMNSGIKHLLQTSTSVKVSHFVISPNAKYTEIWHFKSFTQRFISETSYDSTGKEHYYQEVITDTASGLFRYGNFDLGISVNTRLYGMYEFNTKRIKAIRHTVIPSISFSYIPDLSKKHPEYFSEYYIDTLGNTRTQTIFDNNIFQPPNRNEISNVNFSLNNILEMKHKKRNDTTDKFTVTKLIDSWSFTTAYNLLADSFNWSPMNMNINTRIGRNIIWSTSTSSDFYGVSYQTTAVDEGKIRQTAVRSSEFFINQTGKLLRLTNFRTSIGVKLSGKSTSSEENKKKINDINQPLDPTIPYMDQPYIDFNIPWDININYAFTYSRPLTESSTINSLSFNGSINLTPGWKIRISSSYDFELKRLGFTSIDIVRDLHCWQIDFNVIPFGNRKSFMVNIKVKQGFLQDLKLTKNSRWFDG